jgi:hypothetical protein
VPEQLTSYFWSGDSLRSRSVGRSIPTGTLEVPALPARLLADCAREITRLGLAPGDVEPLSLARARTRWPGYRQCVQAVADWAQPQGLPDLLASSDVALMACRGAPYHHDSGQYGAAAFCNLFLSEDKGQDLHFPAAGLRMPLRRGTVVVFDTGQPHAVIPRHSNRFDPAGFASGHDDTQLFLSWELPIEDPHVAAALQLHFDTDPATAAQLTEAQLWRHGAPAVLCPESGQWITTAKSA